ncbi:MAG: hypothetical protein ACREA0_04185, partial [bacterium]
GVIKATEFLVEWKPRLWIGKQPFDSVRHIPFVSTAYAVDNRERPYQVHEAGVDLGRPAAMLPEEVGPSTIELSADIVSPGHRYFVLAPLVAECFTNELFDLGLEDLKRRQSLTARVHLYVDPNVAYR